MLPIVKLDIFHKDKLQYMRSSIRQAICIGVVAGLISGSITGLTNHFLTIPAIESLLKIAVPDVIGKDYREAELIIGNAGLVPNYLYEISDYPEYIVFYQYPKANVYVRRGEGVLIKYSIHAKAYPELTGINPLSSVHWGANITGKILNYDKVGDLQVYVLVFSPITKRFYVQDRPKISPDGSWAVRLAYGATDVPGDTPFELVVLLTKESLVPEQILTRLPEDAVTYRLKVFREIA